MISRNLRKLRKNIDFNYLRLEAVFQKRNFAIEELIELCKKLRKYKPDYFQKIESLLEKIHQTADGDAGRTELLSYEPKLEKELNDLIYLLFSKYSKLKTSSDFLRVRMKLSLQQIAIKKITMAHNEEVDLYNMRIKQFPDSLFTKRLRPYDLV